MATTHPYTLAEAQEFYETAKTAYLNALTNKSYDVPSRSKENQSVTALEKAMEKWRRIVFEIENGISSGIKVKRIIPYV